jgi:tRNA threonylcarbamoyl adenosine modification protein (Sua5/YciO/YrdC/YwlC family)
MAQYFEVHPDDPQPRLLKHAAQILHEGGLVAIPTDSSYALVCHLDDKAAAERLRRLREVDDKHHLTLLCRDLSELASYARVDNRQYRLLKLGTPGPYTFILEATKEVPRRVSHPSRRTIGLRVPAHTVAQGLLDVLGQPLLGTTLIPPGESRAAERPAGDPRALREAAAGDRRRRRLQAPADHGGRPERPRAGAGARGPGRPGRAGPRALSGRSRIPSPDCAAAETGEGRRADRARRGAAPQRSSAAAMRRALKPSCGSPRTTSTGVPGAIRSR